MENFDMNKMAEMLGKMDKADIEKGMNQITQMMNSKDGENIKNIVSKVAENMNGNSNQRNNYNYGNNQNNNNGKSEYNAQNNSSDTGVDIDPMMILKMKNMLEKMQNTNDPRSNLLKSLKPYLKDSRKEKVDQYVKLFGMSDAIKILNDTRR